MKKETRSTLWDLALLAAGVALPIVLGAVWAFMKTELPLPLWVILAYTSAFGLLFYFVWRRFGEDAARRDLLHTSALQGLHAEHEAFLADEAAKHDSQLEAMRTQLEGSQEQVEKLSGELESAHSIVFSDGLYYRQDDEAHVQPFCRVCRDSSGKLVTVQLDTRNGNFWCPGCNNSWSIAVLPPDPDDVGWD